VGTAPVLLQSDATQGLPTFYAILTPLLLALVGGVATNIVGSQRRAARRMNLEDLIAHGLRHLDLRAREDSPHRIQKPIE
jgi:hypothetical protein